jgi:hypothetical protein
LVRCPIGSVAPIANAASRVQRTPRRGCGFRALDVEGQDVNGRYSTTRTGRDPARCSRALPRSHDRQVAERPPCQAAPRQRDCNERHLASGVVARAGRGRPESVAKETSRRHE